VQRARRTAEKLAHGARAVPEDVGKSFEALEAELDALGTRPRTHASRRG
jgi:hypothetical protein